MILIYMINLQLGSLMKKIPLVKLPILNLKNMMMILSILRLKSRKVIYQLSVAPMKLMKLVIVLIVNLDIFHVKG